MPFHREFLRARAVEVLDSQGYQSTIETGRLLQEDPGNGMLVLRFTAALSD